MGVVMGFIAVASLCLFLGPCSGCEQIKKLWNEIAKEIPLPPPKPSKVVLCNEIVNDLRTLWSYERNYAYRHKSLASSISEMGDGSGIGKDGFVLISSLWEARIDDDNKNIRPNSYRLMDTKTGKQKSIGAYRFGIVPVLTSAGEIDRFSVILVAVPEIPADDDFCFIALCGPVNLQNDFSFDKEWPVYQLKAKKEVVREIRGLKRISIDSLTQRLTQGDLKRYVNRTFRNLYYPKDGKPNDGK